jgi:ABC-2 type transport system permease protein
MKNWKTLRLVAKYISLNIQKDVAYKADSIVTFISANSYIVTFIAALTFIYKDGFTVGGYTYDELFVLLILAQTWWMLNLIFVRKSMQLLATSINTGTLDFYLLKPMRLRALLPFLSFDTRHIWPFLVCLVLFIWKAYPHMASIPQIFLVLLYLVIGIIIIFSFTLFFVSLTFWVGRNNAVFDLSIEFPELIKLPTTFFGGIPEFIFTYILPVILIANPVYQFVFGVIVIKFLVIAALYTATTLILSNIFWTVSLKRYTSAS